MYFAIEVSVFVGRVRMSKGFSCIFCRQSKLFFFCFEVTIDSFHINTLVAN